MGGVFWRRKTEREKQTEREREREREREINYGASVYKAIPLFDKLIDPHLKR